MTVTAKAKAVGAGVGLAAAVAVPYVATSYMVAIITLALIFSLFALSINLLAGYGGLVSLGHGGILGAGAYGVAYMAVRQGASHLEQIGVGLLVALVTSAIFAVMAMRTSQVYFLMVTMAQGMIVWGLVYRSTDLGSENGLRGVYRPEAVAPYWIYYYLCLAVLVACIAFLWVFVRSPFGLSLRGLKESETRVRMLGYNPSLTKFYAFMLSGLLAGIAGVLYAYYHQFVSPAAPQFITSARGVLMVIVGGVGTLAGPVVGSFIIVFVENIASAYVDRWLTLLGVLFILVIMFAPEGLVGGSSKIWHRLVRGGAEDQGPSPSRAAAEDATEERVGAGAGEGSPDGTPEAGGGEAAPQAKEMKR